MKINHKFSILFAVLGLCSVLFSYRAGADTIGPKVSEIGNKHNLSSVAWSAGSLVNNTNYYQAEGNLSSTTNLAGKQVCIFCHTPHSANVEGGAPLWNRNFSTQTFSRYSSDTMQIRVNPAAQALAKYDGLTWKPDGSSKLCLSCHDGVATNPLGAVLRGGPIAMAGGRDFITSDTSISWASFNPSTNKMKFGHHPVSFVYNSDVATAINTGRGGTSYILPTLAGVKLDKSSKMQCTTCHNAHQNQSHDNECYGGSGDCTGGQAFTRKIAPFWVYGGLGTAALDQQAVCLTCHPMTTTPWPP